MRGYLSPFSPPRWGMCVVFLLSFLTGAAGRTPAWAGREPSVFAAIDRAVASGEIDRDEATRYRLLALRAPGALPPALQGRDLAAPRCATEIFREARARLPRFSPEERKEVEALLQSPCSIPGAFAGYVESRRYPARVHYQLDVHRPLAELALRYLEEAWRVEVEEIGFRAPLPDQGACGDDSLDLFLVFGLGYAYTDIVADNPETEWNDYSAYIAIDPNAYGGTILDTTVAHEFNHVLQAADDWFDAPAVYEMTATFVEDLVYDADNDYQSLLYAFQKRPGLPLSFNDGYLSWYMYGSSLYLFFVRDRYMAGDPAFVAEMWLRSRNPTPKHDLDPSANEPDFLDALDSILKEEAGVSFGDAYTEFGRWRWFAGPYDDGAHFEEGGEWPVSATVAVEKTIHTLPATLRVEKGPANTASHYIRLDLSQGRPLPEGTTLSIDFSGEGGRLWEVDTLRYRQGRHDGWQLGTLGEGGSWRVDLSGATSLVVAVINRGEGGEIDPDFPDNRGHPYTISFSSPAGCALVPLSQERSVPLGPFLALLPLIGVLRCRKALRCRVCAPHDFREEGEG